MIPSSRETDIKSAIGTDGISVGLITGGWETSSTSLVVNVLVVSDKIEDFSSVFASLDDFSNASGLGLRLPTNSNWSLSLFVLQAVNNNSVISNKLAALFIFTFTSP
jgi:hypothetical protein